MRVLLNDTGDRLAHSSSLGSGIRIYSLSNNEWSIMNSTTNLFLTNRQNSSIDFDSAGNNILIGVLIMEIVIMYIYILIVIILGVLILHLVMVIDQ